MIERNAEESQKLFEQLVAIKDEINKQIPFAANRFEEFECPGLDEHLPDVDIQYRLHDPLFQLMYVHHMAIEELIDIYHLYKEQNNIDSKEALTENDQRRMSQLLTANSQAIYSKIERIFRIADLYNPSDLEKVKNNILELIQAKLPDLCARGPAVLTVCENDIIDLHIRSLYEHITEAIDKIRNRIPLSDDELSSIDLYRRADTAHEDEVNELFTNLHRFKHFPKDKIDFSEHSINNLLDDARFNIEQLHNKLKNRKIDYFTRYKYAQKLVDIRENLKSNLTMSEIASYLDSVPELMPSALTSEPKEISEKVLISLTKYENLQAGLYYSLQRCDSGYCDEHTSLGLVKIIENNLIYDTRVERVSIQYGDEDGHVFVVINRAEVSDLSDMTTWGDAAILFDAWHKMVCYAKDFEKQNRQYTSFPKDAQWRSIEYKAKDTVMLRQLREMQSSFEVTGNNDPEIREPRIIEEYELQTIPSTSLLHAYLNDVLEQYRPEGFSYSVQFYTTSLGRDLVKYIPGFRVPVIAINQSLITLLVEDKLSLTSFEFAIVTFILQLQMFTSFISPTSISPESQQSIDMQAMKLINSTEASIDYLRAAAEFNNKNDHTARAIYQYERSFAGVNLKYVISFTYLERIKILQSNIAAGIAAICKGDCIRPSPLFQAALINAPTKKPEELALIKVDPINDPKSVEPDNTMVINTSKPSQNVETVASQSEQLPVISNNEEESVVKKADENFDTHIITPTIPKDKWSPSRERIHILKQLIEQLPQLEIELLPYEQSGTPSIRLHQFVDIIRSLRIDFDHPEEAELVDVLINQANELKIPGFEYIYYAFASRWGVNNVGGSYLTCCINRPKTFYSNRYYLIALGENNEWSLVYIGATKNEHPILIHEVPGLKNFLSTKTRNEDLNQNDKDCINYLINNHFGLRRLGFFKEIQAAINAFTHSTCFTEALDNAQKLEDMRKKYCMHLSDQTVYTRKHEHDKKKQKQDTDQNATDPADARFYGTQLGKHMKWEELPMPDPELSAGHHYFRWAKKDQSHLIAATLFRLGLSNHHDILIEMTEEQLQYVAQHSLDYTHLGYLNERHAAHFSLRSKFRYLYVYIAEFRAKQHTLDDSMFSMPSLSFEESFIRYFDSNLPALMRPDLTFNATNAAQDRLLEEFLRIATEGNDLEKAVVHSFFYGRADKRDLKSLVNEHLIASFSNCLYLESQYSQFLLLQNYKGRAHNLFDTLDFKQIDTLGVFYYSYTYDYSTRENKVASLDLYRIMLRCDEKPTQSELFRSLLDACETGDLSVKRLVITQFLKEIGQLEIFSDLTTMLISQEKDEPYLSGELSNALNRARWPSLENNSLNHLSIDELIGEYKLFDRETIFPSSAVKAQVGTIILNRILALPNDQDKITILESWLFSKKRLLAMTDILLKNRIMAHLTDLYASQYGIDDGSCDYVAKIQPLIKKLLEQSANRDVKPFMSQLLTKIEGQNKLSETIGIYADPADFKLFKSKRYKATKNALVSLIKVAEIFSSEPQNQTTFLDFLSNPCTQTNLTSFLVYISKHIDINSVSSAMGWSLYNSDSNRIDEHEKEKSDEKFRSLLMSFYQQFWDCSLYERAAIIESVLIPATKTLSVELQQRAYELGVDYISLKLFPEAQNTASDDYLASCIMRSYLKTADDYTRSYLLAAMLVSANQHTEQKISVGKKLAIICEHMGPAYVKLAQAIHSHPSTSAELRADLAHVKGSANPPHRWTLWRQIQEVLPPELVNRIKRLGVLLGSASYNLAIEVQLEDDTNAVLLLLREGAKASASKGFDHIRATIKDCDHETVVQQSKVMKQNIDEAKRLSLNEMDKEASDQQSLIAQRLYPNALCVHIDGRPIQIEVALATIQTSGQGYRLISRMYGDEFNSLPDATAEERLVKRAVAKAVMTMELHNILRGGQFDSDRHGSQLRVLVDRQNGLQIKIGLYDFGEMALETPPEEGLRQLSDVLHHAPVDLYYSKTIDQMVSQRIERAYQCGESTHFLMRLRKAFLAMHDFNPYLEQKDFIDVLKVVTSNTDIHPILQGAAGRLSFFCSQSANIQQIRNHVNRSGFFQSHIGTPLVLGGVMAAGLAMYVSAVSEMDGRNATTGLTNI